MTDIILRNIASLYKHMLTTVLRKLREIEYKRIMSKILNTILRSIVWVYNYTLTIIRKMSNIHLCILDIVHRGLRAVGFSRDINRESSNDHTHTIYVNHGGGCGSLSHSGLSISPDCNDGSVRSTNIGTNTSLIGTDRRVTPIKTPINHDSGGGCETTDESVRKTYNGLVLVPSPKPSNQPKNTDGDTGQPTLDARRICDLGYNSITKYGMYTNYTNKQIWVVGLSTLIGNHDVTEYDPDEYSDVELFVIALQDKFKDIGGPGVGVFEYLDILRTHYPETVSDVLSLTVVTSTKLNSLTPIIITNTYFPTMLKLYTQVAREMSGVKMIVTDEQLSDIKELVEIATFDAMTEMFYNIPLGTYGPLSTV